MIREAADGTTEIVACLFWMVRHTVIFNPFQSPVALAISSPTFFGDYKKYDIIFKLHIEVMLKFKLFNYFLTKQVDQFLGPKMM